MMLQPSKFQSLDEAYPVLLASVLKDGNSSSPRSLETFELLGCAFTLTDPRKRYISIPSRQWSLAYALGEFCWHTRSSDLTDEIAWYAPFWRKVANCKASIKGSSYGSTIFESKDGKPSQWDTAINLLRKDKDTRRAVLSFNKSEANPSHDEEDIPCTLNLQLIVRDSKLNAICYMRSNDAVIGLPYDVFLFTMLQEMAATVLGYQLGEYTHFIGSLHIYETNIDLAKKVISDTPRLTSPMCIMGTINDLKYLHSVEVKSRETGTFSNEENYFESRYWLNLAKALAIWNIQKHRRPYEIEEVKIDDPLLEELIKMRPFEFSK